MTADPGWLAHRLELEAGSLAGYLGLDPAPPPIPAVDVDGYRPATSVVHRQGGMTVWHHAADPCELCPDPVRGDLRDTDP
jgi:hypothetical protein